MTSRSYCRQTFCKETNAIDTWQKIAYVYILWPRRLLRTLPLKVVGILWGIREAVGNYENDSSSSVVPCRETAPTSTCIARKEST